MAERYTRLYALTENLYQSGAPVMIAAGALLKDTQSGRVLAQLKLQSLSDKPIKAVKVNITPLDVVGNELGEAVEHSYLDLYVRRDKAFGAKSPIALPDATTRAFRAAVTSVVFADNTVWSASEAAWEPLPSPVTLEKVYTDAELRKQFKLEFGAKSQYAYSEFADLCRCSCGALNQQDEMKCHACSCDLLALRGLDIAGLEKRKDERLEQERIAEEERQERKRIEAEEAAVRAKKMKKIAVIAVSVICVMISALILLNSVITMNRTYNEAIELMERGDYIEAEGIFASIAGYRDSTEKVEKCMISALSEVRDTMVEMLESGDYEGLSVGIETMVNNYPDSSENIKKHIVAILDTLYDIADAKMDSGEYKAAIETFAVLDGHKDSAEKIKECEIPALKTAEVGDYVYFGSYEQDNDTSNGKENIQWLVLAVQDGRALLISKYALDCQPYNKEWADATWETCTLRAWLNNDFFTSAFTETEKAMIPVVPVSADKILSYGTNPGNDTQDNVFLLSISEAEEYFASDSARQCQSTDYADTRGAYVASNGNCYWWLRTSDNYRDIAAQVGSEGVIRSIFLSISVNSNGPEAVRPAIWVDLKN